MTERSQPEVTVKSHDLTPEIDYGATSADGRQPSPVQSSRARAVTRPKFSIPVPPLEALDGFRLAIRIDGLKLSSELNARHGSRAGAIAQNRLHAAVKERVRLALCDAISTRPACSHVSTPTKGKAGRMTAPKRCRRLAAGRAGKAAIGWGARWLCLPHALAERVDTFAWLQPFPPYVVRITRIAPGKLDRRDNLNGSGKYVIDAIASYFGLDDSEAYEDRIRFDQVEQRSEGRGVYAVEIVIERPHAVEKGGG